jgi:hypothetical protein
MRLAAYPTRIIHLTRTAHGCRATLDNSPLGALRPGGIATMMDSDWSHVPFYALWKERGGGRVKADFPALAITILTASGEVLSHLLPLPTPQLLHQALDAVAAHGEES